MTHVEDLIRNDVLKYDNVRPIERLQPKINMYTAKHRVMQIELVRRWIPVDLLPIFDELVKES